MRSAVIVLAVSAVAFAGMVAVTLAKAPPRLVAIGAPGVPVMGPTGARGVLGSFNEEATLCQPDETLPAHVTAIRLSMWAFLGARIHVHAYEETRSSHWPLLTQGTHSADWTSDSVTVPVAALGHTVSHVRLCATIGPNSEPLSVLGVPTSPQVAATVTTLQVPPTEVTAVNASVLTGRLAIEYLAPGKRSWWSQLLAVARRLGLGRFYSGTWIALLLAALMAGAGALAVRTTLRELR